jgi:hypothetical protein
MDKYIKSSVYFLTIINGVGYIRNIKHEKRSITNEFCVVSFVNVEMTYPRLKAQHIKLP